MGVTTLRVLSTTTETCLLTAALDQALAERDVWRTLAEDRLRSLRVSRVVLERVLTDVAVSENVIVCAATKTHSKSILGHYSALGAALAAILCGT